jgi:hypothetical protein
MRRSTVDEGKRACELAFDVHSCIDWSAVVSKSASSAARSASSSFSLHRHARRPPLRSPGTDVGESRRE